jgi:glutathione synthase/RimK-type ligase-like ATP-grasp enzyme
MVKTFVVCNRRKGCFHSKRSDAREFRANIHLGGTATVIKAIEEKRIAIKAAKAMDLSGWS